MFESQIFSNQFERIQVRLKRALIQNHQPAKKRCEPSSHDPTTLTGLVILDPTWLWAIEFISFTVKNSSLAGVEEDMVHR